MLLYNKRLSVKAEYDAHRCSCFDQLQEMVKKRDPISGGNERFSLHFVIMVLLGYFAAHISTPAPKQLSPQEFASSGAIVLSPRPVFFASKFGPPPPHAEEFGRDDGAQTHNPLATCPKALPGLQEHFHLKFVQIRTLTG